MTYKQIVPGRFLSRPNRFIARVEINGIEEICHVKNTGRCKELLVPGTEVWCAQENNPRRKTNWSLICVKKGKRLINMDSYAPNIAVREWLTTGGLGFVPSVVKTEKAFENSRFDLYFESDNRRCYIEVKGVTLERDGIAQFPDAPTERGRKHLKELSAAVGQGFDAYILFVIQMSQICYFTPNDDTDPAFGTVLRQAVSSGVRCLAYSCAVTPETLVLDQPVPVIL